MQLKRITPFLWFNHQAEEAARFYCKIFKHSKVKSVGSLAVHFNLDGQDFIGLNGGPLFKFTEAVSFHILCKDQREVDYYWTRLLKGGKPSRCGWLKDKFGLSWQVVPVALNECLDGKDAAGAKRALDAMMKMVKLDVKKLKAAYKGPKT
jgi:predicted 3-demethylubiquinone-9 3-methyltransferase (glyoxalase superfamily)